MADITFEEIVEAAQKLTPHQKSILAKMLELPEIDLTPTRDELLAEFEVLRAAGAFKNAGSLRNYYTNPALAAVTDEELRADIHEAATDWEKELDEFFGDQD